MIALLLLAAAAATEYPPGIYTCDVDGRRYSADHPVAECAGRPQRLLRKDGSPIQIIMPPATEDEAAARDAAARKARAAEQARLIAERGDRVLLVRFPNEAAHAEARRAALADPISAVLRAQRRIAELEVARAKLHDEEEFYPNRPYPAVLRQAIDRNDAAMQAQVALLAERREEVVRVSGIYDDELARLRRLWKTESARMGTQGEKR